MGKKINIISINDIDVEFKKSENEIFSDTITIAKVFKKRHKNVLAKLRSFPDYEDLRGRLKIKPTSILDVQNKKQEMFYVDRDVFTLLVMSFTGDKAYAWKREYVDGFKEYVDGFNKMEKIARDALSPSQNEFYIPQTLPEALRAFAQAEEDRLKLLEVNTVQKKKLDTVVHSNTSLSASQVAKDFGLSSAILFNKILVDARVMFKNSETYELYSNYGGGGLTAIKLTDPDENDKSYKSMRWTQEGKLWLKDNWDLILVKMSDETRALYLKNTSKKEVNVPKQRSNL